MQKSLDLNSHLKNQIHHLQILTQPFVKFFSEMFYIINIDRSPVSNDSKVIYYIHYKKNDSL